MSQKPLTTFEDFSKAMQDFDQIPVMHVYYASSYFALLQCNLVEHPIMDIWEDLDTLRFFHHGEYLPQVTLNHRIAYNNGPNTTCGRIITLFGVCHKVTKWFLHHLNGLILFKRYTKSLDTLKLDMLIGFSLFIIIGEVCMFKSKMSLLGVNNVIE